MHIKATPLGTCSQAPQHCDIFEALKWTIENTNAFYHGLYSYGVWIPSGAAAILVQHGYCMTAACQRRVFVMARIVRVSTAIIAVKVAVKEGYSALSTLSSRRGWALFRVKPKLHMQLHLQQLSCKTNL